MRVATALLASLFFSSALAAPFAVQVGEARIGLDAPPGFADTGFTGSPRLQELAESLTSPSNRILLFAITDGDLRKFTLGDPPDFRRYMIAVTPKPLERERVDRQEFARFSAGVLEELGPNLLGELRREPELVSVLSGARLAAARSQKPQQLLATTTLMLIRGKALSFTVYTAYDGPPDLDWIRAVTARWIEDVQRLNNR